MCKRKIDAELDCFTNDFGFGKFDQWRVNVKVSAFDAGFCSKVGQSLERFDKFRAAIRVAAVINCIYADKNVAGVNHFGRGKRVSQKNGVARRDVCDWNSVPDFFLRALLRNVVVTSECRAAEDTQIDRCYAMFFGA